MALVSWDDLASGWRPTRPCYGVVGDPIAHSKSPAIHAAAYRALGLDAEYHAFQIPPSHLLQGLDLLESAGVLGLNLTVPHKELALPWVRSLSAEASAIGAVNTLCLADGARAGHNTDARGFSASVREDLMLSLRELRLLVLGSGGAAKAVALRAAMEECDRLVIANRTPDKAHTLAAQVSAIARTDKLQGQSDRIKALALDDPALRRELETVDLIVNCTTLGLRAGDPSPLPDTWLQPHHIVYDTIYNPPKTPLMAAALEAGGRAVNGVGMLAHQGALSFELWFSQPAPLAAMRAALG